MMALLYERGDKQFVTSTRRTIVVFLISTALTLCFLSISNDIAEKERHQKMEEYAHSSFRESDGAENLVIMNGKPGRIGGTDVSLIYEKDGYIRLLGSNTESISGWKLISEFKLEPGIYTFTGLKNHEIGTIELQFSTWNEQKKGNDYYCQYDEDISVTITEEKVFYLHVRVYPNLNYVDTIARPAVYKNET